MSTKNTVSRELNVESEVIGRRIYIIRSQKVVLSTHLAELYGVKPKTLIQAVKRKASRFLSDFMFKLTKDEFDSLRSQIVTLEKGRGRIPSTLRLPLRNRVSPCCRACSTANAPFR